MGGPDDCNGFRGLEERTADVKDVRLRYYVGGEGPPLILVHGLAGAAANWVALAPLLIGRFRLLVPDLPGHAGSSPLPAAASLDPYADRLIRLAAVEGFDQAAVVGHSMGGLIAAELAADRPDLVDQLVLVDAAGLPFRARFVTHVVNVVRSTLESSPRFLAMAFVDSLRAGPFTLIAATRSILASDLSEKLGRIAAPTLVLWGADDPLIPAAIGRELTNALRDGRFELVEGAGHSPMWERPERFTALVRQFVRGRGRIRDAGATATVAA
jgi:pimeloyl-ACP methyl ester carboxylesterase